MARAESRNDIAMGADSHWRIVASAIHPHIRLNAERKQGAGHTGYYYDVGVCHNHSDHSIRQHLRSTYMLGGLVLLFLVVLPLAELQTFLAYEN